MIKKSLYTIIFMISFLYSKAQFVIHTDNTYQNVALQSGKKIAYLSMYQSVAADIEKYKRKTTEDYLIIEQVQNRIYHSLNEVDELTRQAKSAYYAGKQIIKMSDNLAKAGKLAAKKPYLLVYWRKMAPVMIGRAMELQSFMTDYIQKNKKDVLMNKTARDIFLWNAYEDIEALYNLSAVMLLDFKRVTLAEAVNTVVPYEYYLDLDKSIIQTNLERLKRLL